MASTKKSSEGNQVTKTAGAESDVASHGPTKVDTKATTPSESVTSSAKISSTEADVEGHNFGHNAMISRNVAQSRERDIQRTLRDHEQKAEARRPFFKRGK